MRSYPKRMTANGSGIAALLGLKIGDYATQLLERGVKEDFQRLHNQHHEELSQEDDG
jgi:hypothetical protein